MNKKYTQDNLLAIVNLAASGSPSNIDQARAVGISEDSLRDWKFRSNAGDPEFIIPWLGREMQFAEALAISRRFHYNEVRARTESWLTKPRKRETLFQGQKVPALDPVALPLDEETRIMCGYHPQAWLLDDNGAVVWNTEEVEAPAAILIKFLETFKDLQPISTVNSNVNVNGQIGIGYAKPTDYSKDAPQIPPPPPIPQVEILPDPELDDMLNGKSVIDATDTPEPEDTTEPEPVDVPVPSAPLSVAIDATSRRAPRNALEADLFARLDALRNKPKDAANG